MAIGRISGSVLKSNLTRNGTDLAFETNLLYLDVTNSRIGIGTSEPSTTLHVNGNTTLTGNLTVDTQTLHVDSSNNRVGIGTASPAYQFEIENTGSNALLVLDRTDGAACFIEGQATRSAFGSVGATPLVLAYNSLAVISIGAGGAITVNPDGGSPFTLPTADGTAGQVLATDGAGNVTFTDLSLGDLTIIGSTISTPSNADLELSASGTGRVVVNNELVVNTLSSDDSSAIQINDAINVAGDINIAGNILPTTTLTYNLGSTNYRFNELWLAGTTIDLGGTKLSIDGSGDFEVKDSSGNRKNVVADSVFIGTGASKIKLSRSNNGKLKFTDENDTDTAILTVVGDDSTGVDLNSGETISFRGATGITTAVSGDTLTITGPDLKDYLKNTGTQTIDNLSFNDNIISTSSNADLVLQPGGTGQVVLNSIKSDDSSAIRINDGLSMAGSIIPAADNTYDLGTATSQWRDIYVSAGSLYINNKPVLQEVAGDTTVSTDTDENLVVKTAGTGVTTIQSASQVAITATGSGDVTLTTSTGNIELKGTVEILSGKKIIDSAGINVEFSDAIHMNNNRITNVGDPVSGQDVATKAYVDNNTASLSNVFSVVGDDSSGTSFNFGETFKIAGTQNVSTAVVGDTITITGPDLTSYATTSYVDTEVAGLVDTAPETLNTLNELAAALGDDANFATTTSTALGNRLRVDTNAQGLTTDQKTNAKTNLGLSTVASTGSYNDLTDKPAGASFSGSYNDLTDKPTIPTNNNQLTNGAGYITDITLNVVADDSATISLSNGGTLLFNGEQNITTSTDSSGVVTITGPNLTNYLQSGTSVSVSNITASGTVYTDTITPPASNMDLIITASGTGSVSIGGYTLPSSDGTAGQVLQTNGSGTLSFTTVSTTSLSEGNSSVTVADSGTGTITVTADSNTIGVFSNSIALNLATTTNAIKLPTGTTAQRPSGAVGLLRYNSSTDKYEGYTTADGWIELGATAASGGVADSGAATIGIGLNTANIDSFTTSTYDSAWYYAVTNDEVNGQKATQKYSLVHNDTDAFVGVSHQIETDPANDYLAITADVSSGTVRIRGTGATDTNSVSYYRVPLGDNTTNTTSGAVKNFILADTTSNSTAVNTYITTGESTAITSTEKSMNSFATSAFDSAWYLTTHRDETNSDVKVEKYATAHNGSTAVISISGTTRNDDSNAYTQATADVLSSTFRLRGTATSATNSMSYWRIALGNSTTQETVGATKTTVNTDVDSDAEQIDSWAYASYRGAKYYISAKNSDTNQVATTEALVVHDGTTAYVSQYNQIYTSSGYPIHITATIVGSNVVVSAGGDGNNWKVTTYRILLSDSETDSNDGSTSIQGYTLNTVTVSSSATEIDSFASATTTGAFYVVTGASAGETAYSAQEVYVVTDGSGAYVTNGPFVSTKDTSQLSFTADYSGGSVSLKAASTSGASTTVSAYKVQMLRGDAGLATIDSFTGGSTNRAAKYYFSVNDIENNRLTNTEALVVHDGTDAYITQYGTVNTSDVSLITLSAEYSGGTVYVKAEAGTSRVTGYRILLQDDQTATSSDNTAVIAETTGVSSTATEIDSWQTDAITGAFYVVAGYNSTEGVASAAEVMVITGGSSPYNGDVFIGTGPTISSKSSDQLEFSATISGTTVSVKAASTSGASTNVSAYRVNLLRGDGGQVAANVTIAGDQSISGAKTFAAPVALQVSASAPTVEANKAHIYSKDVLVSVDNYKAEIFVQDELGNETKISPHNAQGEWEYFSRNTLTGKTVRINMEEMIRDLEQLTGKTYIKDQ